MRHNTTSSSPKTTEKKNIKLMIKFIEANRNKSTPPKNVKALPRYKRK